LFPFISNYFISNRLFRKFLSNFGIDPEAEIPKFQKFKEIENSTESRKRKLDRKVLLYSTCLGNYNTPNILNASKEILELQGCEVKIDYSMCCGMPQLEQGDLASVTKSAKQISSFLKQYLDNGFTVLTFVPSCSLMFKSEWPSLLPEDENVKLLSKHTKDICEYICEIAKTDGLVEGIQPISYPVTLHHACHARALNVGNKAHEMLKYIPEIKMEVIERCSGHGNNLC
jgi:glycerol-3-phosphate dehydrogenase subunit C